MIHGAVKVRKLPDPSPNSEVKMKESLEILTSIPAEIDLKELQRRLRMKPGKQWDQVQSLVEAAKPVITPKVAYRVCYIDEKRIDSVIIDGIELKSAVLRKQLEEVERVFPHVLTIGSKLETMANETGDYVEQFYLDTIANVALTTARRHFETQLQARFGLGKISRLGPGSLEAWPINEQMPLFSILGDVESLIGVKLTDSFLMIPRKSSSGIYFPTEIPFFACQLCPRKECPSRKAAYDVKKAKEYGLEK